MQVGHLEHVLRVPAAIVHGFAEAVADALVAGVLPYADRQRLLRRAARLGIGRFDANLIIASVQHRESPTSIDRPIRQGHAAARGGTLGMVAWVLATESVLIALATLLLAG